MTASLLDVNVLIGLIDSTHKDHRPAMRWFMGGGNRSWLTCPITQMGPPRIIAGNYSKGLISPVTVVEKMRQLMASGDHTFVPDDIDLLRSHHVTPEQITSSGMVTDSYLLALAVKHDAMLVTFDRNLSAAAVPGGASHLLVLDSP